MMPLYYRLWLLIAWLSVCNNPDKPAPTPKPNVVSKQSPQPTPPLARQDSQILAADLQAATSLHASFQALAQKFPGKPGQNTDAAFVGIQGMKAALRDQPGSGYGNLTQFKKWAQEKTWEQFGEHHYDWWMFPIDRATHSQRLQYTVYQQDISDLKKDIAWLKDYRLGAILLMQSWGWDVKKRQCYANPAPGQQWSNHDVRLGKLAHSLILFQQWDLYASLQAYVSTLRNQRVPLASWVLAYF